MPKETGGKVTEDAMMRTQLGRALPSSTLLRDCPSGSLLRDCGGASGALFETAVFCNGGMARGGRNCNNSTLAPTPVFGTVANAVDVLMHVVAAVAVAVAVGVADAAAAPVVGTPS